MQLFQHGDSIGKRVYRERYLGAPDIKSSWRTFHDEPNIAIYWPTESVLAELEDSPCHFRTVPAFFFVTLATIYVKKNWAYQDLLNYQ